MAWQQLIFSIENENDAQIINDTLQLWDALAITIEDAKDDPIYEPPLGTEPLWQHSRVIALFDEKSDLEEIAKAILAQTQLSIPYHIVALPDQDWVHACQKDFKPMQFGDRLWICPSWSDAQDINKIKNGVTVILDPGVAFGTGTHATTAQCLRRLDQIDLKNKTVIDYGCGSGVLAIAAIKLGAQQAWGIDIDPQALTATRENAKRNEIKDSQLNLALPENFSKKITADILVANILANPLIELAETLCAHLNKSGALILSGILEEQADEVRNAYRGKINWQACTNEDGWCCLSGVKL